MAFFRRQRELYLFRVGSVEYPYTNASKNVVYDGTTYSPTTIGRNSIKLDSEIVKNNLVVKVADSNPVAKAFIVGIPEESVFLTLLKEISGAPNTFAQIYSGVVTTKEFKSGHKADLICQSLSGSTETNGLRRRLSKTCTYRLYDSNTCKASAINHVSTVVSVDGRTVTLDDIPFADNYFTGGILSVSGDKRTIAIQTGDVLELVTLSSAKIGDTVSITAGCNHSINACNDKFNNLENFGGQPFIPDDNPFDGGLI